MFGFFGFLFYLYIYTMNNEDIDLKINNIILNHLNSFLERKVFMKIFLPELVSEIRLDSCHGEFISELICEVEKHDLLYSKQYLLNSLIKLNL